MWIKIVKFQKAWKASVPLVFINTSDIAATRNILCELLPTDQAIESKRPKFVAWDVGAGLWLPPQKNSSGAKEAVSKLLLDPKQSPAAMINPALVLRQATLLPEGSVLIMENLANLHLLPPVSFFMALPLKIKNGTGSPIRAVALVER